MKRKRGAGRRKLKRSQVAGANMTSVGSVCPNAEDAAGFGDSENDAFDFRMEVETAQAGATLNASLEDPVFINKTNGSYSKHENNLLKNVVSIAAKLSRTVSPSSPVPHTNARSLQGERIHDVRELRSPRQDPEYNEKELNAALSVIKKIMKLDAAKPFNIPVDPVALGIPDYFDVIDTPMDLGTICDNLELGLEYRNSKDVYKDVELIWDNCYKYNKKGDHVLELMKQVKINFIKLWTAAGLFREQQDVSNVHLERNLHHATEYNMRSNKYGHTCQAGSLISNSIHWEQPDAIGRCQVQQLHHSSGNSHEYHPQKISSQCQCQWCYRELQPSQPQNSRHIGANGHLHPPIHDVLSSSAFNKDEHVCPSVPMTGNTDHQNPYQMCPSRTGRYQLPLLCADQYQPHQLSCQCHSSSSQFRVHRQVRSRVESTMRHTKRRLEYSTAPVTGVSSCQKHSLMGPSQLETSSMIHGRSYQPQEKRYENQQESGFPEPSLPQAGANVGGAGRPPMPPHSESLVRCASRKHSFSIEPVSNDCSPEQECQMGPTELELPSLDHSPPHEPNEDGLGSQPSSSPPKPSLQQDGAIIYNGDSTGLERKNKGRGPTRCLDILREGRRIFITTNELGQPVGLEAPKLISFLGTLARNGHLAPLNYADWRAVPEANKENMWDEVQNKFIIDPISKIWVIKSLGKKWRDWKSKLKTANYLTHATDEERLADCDERVLPDQWEYLVSHWSSVDAEKRSDRNKANRAKQKFRHVTGTKSFARIREEQRAKRPDGKAPSRAELFILTRTRKDGKPVNEESSAVITQLHEIACQQHDTSKNNTAQDEALSRILGREKNGRIRCCGLGSSPSDLGGTKPTLAEATKMVSEANAEVHQMKERLVAMEQTCSQMVAQMATMMSMMASMQRNLPDESVPELATNPSGTSEGLPQHQVHSTPLRRSSRFGRI